MRINCNSSTSCVVFQAGKVLLVRHTYGLAKDKYLIPGGNALEDEMPEQTGIREVFEETKVNIKPTGLLAIRFVPGRIWCVFMADYISGEPISDLNENDSAIFMDITEALKSKDVIDTTKELIRCALDGNKKIYTLSDYISISSPDYTRENWHLYC